MAPIKKPAAGSAGKAGTGILGKASSSIGKSSGMASSAKSTNIMGSSSKSNKFMGSSSGGGYSAKSGSYISSTLKSDSLLGSAGKSSKIVPTSPKNTNVDGGKSSYSPASGKTGSFFGGYNAKLENTLGSNGKSKMPGTTEKNSFSPPSGKSSNLLGGLSNKPSAFSGKSSSDASKDYPSFISPQSNKSQTKIGIIWIPTRKRNKKKELVYNSHNYDHYHEKSPSMYSYMAGDSPSYQQPHKKKEEETDLLVPERPKVTSVAVNTGITAATIDVPSDNSGAGNAEEKQEFLKQNSEDGKDAAGDSHERTNRSDSEYLENNDNIAKSQDNKWDQDKQGDKVDSVFLRPPPPHKARSAASTNDEEDCGIKCLYYTLQCCDCVLM